MTTVKDGANVTVDNQNPAALGTPTHDTAVLGGAVNGFPLGGASDPATVTYEFFNQTTCPSGAHTDQTVAVAADGTVPGSTPQTLGAGSYAYLAVYSGNSNYAGKTGACEPFTITKAPSTVVTTVKDGANVTVDNANPGLLGVLTHDTAVLGGTVGSFPLGGASDPATLTVQSLAGRVLAHEMPYEEREDDTERTRTPERDVLTSDLMKTVSAEALPVLNHEAGFP